MQIPIHAQVVCTDGTFGRCVRVIINPFIDQITHLVVKEETLSGNELLVPIDLVSSSTTDTVVLNCTKDHPQEMDPIIQTQ